MALKTKLTKAEFDSLPEAKRKVYQDEKVYVPDGEDWKLDAEFEDVTGLKNALAAKTKERNDLKAKLEAEAEKWKDLDPERAREALKTLAEIDDKKLHSQGEFDRLLKKRSDEFDAREAESKKKLDETLAQLEVFQLINPVQEAAIKAGVLPKSLPLVLSDIRLNKKIRLNDKREPVIVDKDGDPTDLTLDAYFDGAYKNEYPNLYAASGAAGSGAGPSNGGASGKKTVSRKQLEELPPAEQRTVSLQAAKGELVLTD